LERGPILNAVLICSAVELLLIPLFGSLSERIGHRRLFLGAAMASVAVAFPFFMLFNTGNFFVITAAMSITIGIACAMFALEPAVMGALFPVEVRTSAVSIGYQTAAVFAGGLSPFIATGLYAWSGRQWWPIAAYLAVMGLITVVSTHFATKAAKTPKADVVVG
jgi:MFS family permease